MSDWDADTPRLKRNLTKVFARLRLAASERATPSVASAKIWQKQTMAGLTVPNAVYVGRFRGEPGLENCQVRIGSAFGVAPAGVAAELQEFELRLRNVIAALDSRYPVGNDLDVDGLAAVVELAAWAHCEWVRIHPFANGNGRTARMWANLILMRYGIPPSIRLRPRPAGGYGAASARAMNGDWKPTALLFHEMVRDATSAAKATAPTSPKHP